MTAPDLTASRATIADLPQGAQAEMLALVYEVERLRGLLWFAWYEFNDIRARSGAPTADRASEAIIAALADGRKA